jgi:protochlorophyllide reductase
MPRSTSAAAAFYAAFLLLHNASAFTVPFGVTRGVKGTCVQSSLDDEQYEAEPSGMSRRDALTNSGAALASILLGGSALSWPSPAFGADYGAGKRTVILTGANSGIGYDAAVRMAARGHKLILACRTISKAKDTASRIKADLAESGSTLNESDLIPLECDLANLQSIDSFAKNVKNTLGDDGIDSLCLNAGLARDTAATDVLRTADGFELTVGTNHFGHFHLNSLLLPKVKRNGRIIVTASGVHDPDGPGGAQGEKATLGDLSGLERDGVRFEMVDGAPFNADKAYKDSKLCNVLFTRELQRKLDAGGTGITTNCFNPGLIVSTGLFRDQNPAFTKVFDFAATKLLKVGETPHWGGGSLEYMALDRDVASKGGLFYSSPPGSSKYGDEAFGHQFTVTQVSKEARDDAKAAKLWQLTEKLIADARSP